MEGATLRFRTFGVPRLAVWGDDHPVFGSGAALLAYLAIGNRPRSREEILAALWSDSVGLDEGAPLRTARARLRSAFPNAELVLGRGVLHLAPEVETDLADLDRRERRLLAEADPTRRAADLDAIADVLAQPFLTGVGGAWVEATRRRFAERRHRVMSERLATRARDGETEKALTIAREWLRDDAANEEAISALAALGARDEARRRATDLRRRGLRVSEACLSAVERAPSRVVRGDEGDGEWLRAILSADPVALGRLVASDRRTWVFGPRPRASLAVLDGLHDRLPPGPDRWEIAFQRASLHRTLSEWTDAIRISRIAREEMAAAPPCRQAIDFLALDGFVHFELRQPAASEEAFAEGDALARRWDRPEWRRILDNNHAVVLYHSGRYAESRRTFHDILAREEPDPRWRAHAVANAHMNLCFLEAVVPDWPAIRSHAAEAIRGGAVEGDRQMLAGGQCLGALARAAMGDHYAVTEILESIGGVAHYGMRRYSIVLLDVLAEGMSHLGDAEGARLVLAAGGDLRDDIAHPRSVAEAETIARLGPDPSVKWTETRSVGAVTGWADRRIRRLLG